MRQRRGGGDAGEAVNGEGVAPSSTGDSNGDATSALKEHPLPPGHDHQVSLLKARNLGDVFSRIGFVGIFILENLLHAVHFELEVQNLVMPALAPLPREVAVCLHISHIVLGLFGALFVIVSVFDSAGRTALTKGAGMLIVFMCTITWTWWINRDGLPIWQMDPTPFWRMGCDPQKRNRVVHICKNISITGSMLMYKRLATYDTKAFPAKPTFLEGLVTSLRIWSLATTLAPLLVLMAVLQPRLGISLPSYWLVFAKLLSLAAVQVSANLVNSYVDFKKGIDTKETASDRTMVDGLVAPGLLKVLAAGFLVWWLVFFAWTAVAAEFHYEVMFPAILGTGIAVGYTAGPAPLKYIGCGDLSVFLCFGPLLAMYSSHVLVGQVPFEAMIFILPVTLYIVGILHANNYRDIEVDRRSGAVTVAALLGPRLSLHYYTLLLFGAHVSILCIGWFMSCAGVVASFIVLPQTVWLFWRIRQPSLVRKQDEETAKSAMMFGLSLAIGITTMPHMEISWPGLGFTAFVVGALKFLDDD